MVITEHVLYLISQQDYLIILHRRNFSLSSCLCFNFRQDHAICLAWACSPGNDIRDRCTNMTFILCAMYNKSHAISYKRNMTNAAVSLSCSPLPILPLKSCNRNVYPHFHILPFLLHYSMASCCFEILRLKKKKTPLMFYCENFKEECCCNWPWSN